MKKSILAVMVVLVILLVGCSTVKTPQREAIKLEAEYSLVGYNFVYVLDGNMLQFKFIDIVGVDEIPLIATTLMNIMPGAVSYEMAGPGKMLFILDGNMSEEQFNTFVETANGLIYKTFFK